MLLRRSKAVILITAALAAVSCGKPETAANVSRTPAVNAKKDDAERIERLKKQRASVTSFFQPMKVRPGDWLQHHKEKGQTFEEYLASDPAVPTPKRKTIYILPIGDLSAEQLKILETTAEYMRVFYSLPVKFEKVRPLGDVPADKKRKAFFTEHLQVKTSYFLGSVLPSVAKNDAAATIGLTNVDLYTGDTSMAYVFGQASLAERIGVWSLFRLERPRTKALTQATVLDRTLKIAMHETGHMFGMRHCTKYECLMSGTNSTSETDRRPLDVCPECMAKLAWAMNYEPAERYRKLSALWRSRGRIGESERAAKMAAAVDAIK